MSFYSYNHTPPYILNNRIENILRYTLTFLKYSNQFRCIICVTIMIRVNMRCDYFKVGLLFALGCITNIMKELS